MQNKDMMHIDYRIASLEEIIALRESVLIQGTDRHTPFFEGDQEVTTLHFGAFSQEGAVGCLTYMVRDWENQPAWQLRGMATHLEWRGNHIGRILIQYAETVLREKSGLRLLWCNARSGAVGFYEKQGWQIVSEEFLIDGVGPHYRMIKTIE